MLPLGAALALWLTGDSTQYAALPNQTRMVGISLGAVGVMLGANRLIRILGNLLAATLNDRLGWRRLFLQRSRCLQLSLQVVALRCTQWQGCCGR